MQGDWLPARAALHPSGLFFSLREIRPELLPPIGGRRKVGAVEEWLQHDQNGVRVRDAGDSGHVVGIEADDRIGPCDRRRRALMADGE